MKRPRFSWSLLYIREEEKVMRKFWQWKNQKENQESNEILERTLFLNGTIAEES